jgi:hypothetical protein
LLVFNPKNNDVKKVKEKTFLGLNSKPSGRSGHSSIVYKNEMFIFGGNPKNKIRIRTERKKV